MLVLEALSAGSSFSFSPHFRTFRTIGGSAPIIDIIEGRGGRKTFEVEKVGKPGRAWVTISLDKKKIGVAFRSVHESKERCVGNFPRSKPRLDLIFESTIEL